MIGGTQPLAPVLAPVVRRRRAQWLRALRRDRTTVLAGLLVVLIVAGSLILPAVLPYRYDQQSLDHTFEGPSAPALARAPTSTAGTSSRGWRRAAASRSSWAWSRSSPRSSWAGSWAGSPDTRAARSTNG